MMCEVCECEVCEEVLLSFGPVRKIAKSDCQLRHVCPSFCVSVWNFSVPAGWILMKIGFGLFFENLSRKSKSLKPEIITGTVYENLCIFTAVYP